MLDWIKSKFTKIEYVESFNYKHYDWVYNGKCLAHICADLDDKKPLYQYGTAPCGTPLVCNDRHVNRLFNTKWIPVSLQSIDPDAPLTSEIMG